MKVKLAIVGCFLLAVWLINYYVSQPSTQARAAYDSVQMGQHLRDFRIPKWTFNPRMEYRRVVDSTGTQGENDWDTCLYLKGNSDCILLYYDKDTLLITGKALVTSRTELNLFFQSPGETVESWYWQLKP